MRSGRLMEVFLSSGLPTIRRHWEVITDRNPSAQEMKALRLAWKVCKHTKSNTIIFADDRRTLGIGAGQMNRVDSARIAIEKACAPLKGSARSLGCIPAIPGYA